MPAIRSTVTGIAEDPDGTLWVGTEGGGLFERSPATGAFTEALAENPGSVANHLLSALLRDRAGRLWVGTRGDGLARFDRTTRRFVTYRHDAANPHSLGSDGVWGLAEDATGNLWVATYGGGLSVLDRQTGTFRRYRHDPAMRASSGHRPPDLHRHRSRRAALAGHRRRGPAAYDPATSGSVGLVHDPADPASLSQNVVRTLYEDAQGQLWVGTLRGAQPLRSGRAPRSPTSRHDPSDPGA